MARRRAPVIVGEDTTALPQAVNTALNAFVGQLRVTDVMMLLDGDKRKLAMELAGTSDKKSTAYKTQVRNVGRWLKSESGQGGQKRKPSAATQEKLNQIVEKNHPPRGATIDMTGYISYDDDVRWRHLTVSLSGSALASMLSSIEAGNVHAAYGEIFAAYGAAHLEMGDDSSQIAITFR